MKIKKTSTRCKQNYLVASELFITIHKKVQKIEILHERHSCKSRNN